MAALLVLALAGAVLGATNTFEARAQAVPPAGTIAGELSSPDSTLSLDGTRVEVVGIDGTGGIVTFDGTSEGARFAIEAPADPGTTYLVRAFIDGVTYFSTTPVLLSPDLPSADVSIEVFGVTNEAPALRIASTTVTMLALDRAAGEMTFVREDIVLNPSLETYVGADGPSVRLPLPDGATAADGTAAYGGIPVPGTFAVEGATLNTDAALRPGETSLVSQFIVGYDRDADAYRLRLTPSLPTDSIEVLVPETFVGRVEPAAEAERGEDATIEGETLVSIVSTGALEPGRSLLVDLEGLSGAKPPSPLTSMPGAAIGLGLALGVIAVGAHLVSLGRARGAAGTADA
ncbi:MAG: hypothetical protein R3C39_02130 [Dehalococcoidia bacterium]